MRKTILILYVLMAMAITASAASGFLITETGNNIQITMINQEPMPAEPGGYLTLRFRIENIGTQGADNVQVELIPQYPFSFDASDSGLRNLSSMDGWQTDNEGVVVEYRLRVDEDAVEGSENITLRYKVGQSPWIGQDFAVQIRTIDAFLNIDEITTSPTRVQPGEFTDLLIHVTNLADSRLTNLRFKLDFNNIDISPAASTNEKTILSLKAHENATVSFRVVVNSDAVSKVYKVPLSIEYFDEVGTKYTVDQTAGIVVYGQPEYFMNVESANAFTAGSKGDIVLSISNTGTAEMRFVTLELVPNDNYSVLSTPKIYIGNIDSDNEETADFTIMAKGKAGMMPLDVIVEYKDAYNKYFKAKEKVELKVYTNKEAAVYGLVQTGSTANAVLFFSPVVLLSLFWIYTLRDCWINKKKGFDKTMWLIAIIGGTVLGAIVYYFIGRKKQI
jgi:hypothetical protein